jgi:hypothetical protein
MGKIKNTLAALAIALGSAFPAYSQDKPKEEQKQEEKAQLTGYQFSMPDDAFPDKEGYARIKGEMPTGDYDGKGFGIDGRVPVGGFSGAARIVNYNGDSHPASVPFAPEPPVPDMGGIPELESTRKHTAGELSASIDRLKVFAKYGKFEKEASVKESDVLADDAFFYLAFDTRNNVLQKAKVFSAGIGYDFGKLSASIAGFTNKSSNGIKYWENMIFTDKGTGITTEDITETTDSSEISLAGALPNLVYVIDKDFMLDLHAIIGKRKTEINDDRDSETIIRPMVGASWNNLFARAGCINKNMEGDGKFIGTLGYAFDLGGVQVPAMAGLDDNGNAYFGGMLVVGGNPEQLRNFMLYLPDNTASPLEDEIMKTTALLHKVEGIARSSSFFLGAYVRKADEAKIDEYGTREIKEENIFVPMIGFSAGPVTLSGQGIIAKEHQGGEANIYLMFLKNFGVGAGAKYQTGKDSLFDEEVAGAVSLIGRF